jgi:hypothetical protein
MNHIDPSRIIFKCEDRYTEGVMDGITYGLIIISIIVFIVGLLFNCYYKLKLEEYIHINGNHIRNIILNTRILELEIEEETKEDNPSHLHRD